MQEESAKKPRTESLPPGERTEENKTQDESAGIGKGEEMTKITQMRGGDKGPQEEREKSEEKEKQTAREAELLGEIEKLRAQIKALAIQTEGRVGLKDTQQKKDGDEDETR